MVVLVSSLLATARVAPAAVQGLTINPTSWTTSAQVGDTTSQTFTVTFSGKGNSGPLTTTFVYAVGNPPYFSTNADTNSCSGATLTPRNPTCSVTVYFNPSAAATSTETLYVVGRKLQTSAVLSGTGQAATLPGLSINDRTIPYGGNMIFTVTMSKPSTTPVTFDWATADGTAVWVTGTTCGGFDGPNDYVGGSGSKTIAAGATSTTISVVTCSTGPGNRTPDPTTFTVTISNPSGATITDGTGIGTLNPT